MKNSPKKAGRNKKSSTPSSVFTIMVMVVAITMVGLVLTDAMGLGSTVKDYLGSSSEPVTTTYSHPLMGGQPVPAENDGDCLACHKSLP